MGQSTHPKGQPTYEQLQEVIRRKDLAVREAYWNAIAIKSVAWLAHQAQCGGNHDFTTERYAEAASWAFKMIADRVEGALEELEEAHSAEYDAELTNSDVAGGRP